MSSSRIDSCFNDYVPEFNDNFKKQTDDIEKKLQHYEDDGTKFPFVGKRFSAHHVNNQNREDRINSIELKPSKKKKKKDFIVDMFQTSQKRK